jgi:hypothetical protein
MKGPVTCCSDDILKKIIRSLAPVMMSAQDVVKISIPPLPRYVFHSCCNNPSHCPNLLHKGHAEKMLNGVSGMRAILKKESIAMGVKNHWVLDGVGAVAGIPVGQSGGSNRDLVPELAKSLAKDGVHLTTEGNRNLAKAIVAAIAGLKTGKLTKITADTSVPGGQGKLKEYFWRGFRSPVGDDVGRAQFSRLTPVHHQQDHQRGRAARHFHPYKKKF